MVKNSTANEEDTGSIPGSGKSHGQRSLVGYNSWGHKDLDLTEHAHTYLKGLTDRVLFFIKRIMGASKARTQTMLDLNGKP